MITRARQREPEITQAYAGRRREPPLRQPTLRETLGAAVAAHTGRSHGTTQPSRARYLVLH